MAWQDGVQTLTQSFSVEALADAGTGTSLSAPSTSVVNLDGKILKLLIAGTLTDDTSATVQVNSTDFIKCTNPGTGATQAFFVELPMCWSSAKSQLVYSNQYQAMSGLNTNISYPGGGPITGMSSQSTLSFSISGAASLTQFTLKLA